MRFYDFIEQLKKENQDKIVMVKNGVFFNAIGRDAIILDKTIGLKRTCYSKALCKCGMPVTFVRENTERVKKKFKDKNISIIFFDEMKNGQYKYFDKTYGILFCVEAEPIKETALVANCEDCSSNRYAESMNTYTIAKKDYDKLDERVKKLINSILNKK